MCRPWCAPALVPGLGRMGFRGGALGAAGGGAWGKAMLGHHTPCRGTPQEGWFCPPPIRPLSPQPDELSGPWMQPWHDEEQAVHRNTTTLQHHSTTESTTAPYYGTRDTLQRSTVWDTAQHHTVVMSQKATQALCIQAALAGGSHHRCTGNSAATRGLPLRGAPLHDTPA